MKIISSVSLVLFLGVQSLAQNSVQSVIDRFVNYSDMANASVSFNVIDASTGKTVASHDPNRTLPTASTTKLFATATALELLGSDYRPSTRLYADGEIDSNGVLKGNLYIRGGGDPSLGSKYFYDKAHRRDFLYAWVDTLVAKGITKIDGRIIADASEFGYEGAPDGWNWVDMGNYYGAGPSGLTIFDNLIEFNFRVPASIGATSKIRSIRPHVPWMTFTNYVQASSRAGDNAYIYGAPYSMDRFARGTLPAGTSSFVVKGSLPDPERQFAYELSLILTEKGIAFEEYTTARSLEIMSNNTSYESRELLLDHKGKSLGEIIDLTNFRSVNLFAEHLVCLVGYVKGGKGNTYTGLATLEAYWANKFMSTGLHVNDGSGLSRTNAIAAKHFTGLLLAMHKSKNSKRFKASLPTSGETGTMRYICDGQAGSGRIQAKSGSMTRIKSYSGYVSSRSGKTLIFALIVNDQGCNNSTLITRMESVMNAIAIY